MAMISFAWTSAQLIAGRKTVTRRNWTNSYAEQFRKNMLVYAYDKSQRFRGKKIALIKLTDDLKLELLEDMPDRDYEAEGFSYLEENRHLIPASFCMMPGETMMDRFNTWRYGVHGCMWVIRFKLVRVYE